MKTALFPFVVLIHAFSMMLEMASLSFLVFIGRLSTFLVLVLLSLTASLAVTSSKLALCIARTPHERRSSVSGDGAPLLRGHGRIDCFDLRSSKRRINGGSANRNFQKDDQRRSEQYNDTLRSGQ